jgi:hypothetical protein
VRTGYVRARALRGSAAGSSHVGSPLRASADAVCAEQDEGRRREQGQATRARADDESEDRRRERGQATRARKDARRPEEETKRRGCDGMRDGSRFQ